jgi:hypothetical protein
MKTLGSVVLLLALTSAGCLDRNNLTPFHHSSPPPKAPDTAKALRPPPEVTVDQVHEGNAHAIVQALNDELDREERGRSAPAISQPEIRKPGP